MFLNSIPESPVVGTPFFINSLVSMTLRNLTLRCQRHRGDRILDHSKSKLYFKLNGLLYNQTPKFHLFCLKFLIWWILNLLAKELPILLGMLLYLYHTKSNFYLFSISLKVVYRHDLVWPKFWCWSRIRSLNFIVFKIEDSRAF